MYNEKLYVKIYRVQTQIFVLICHVYFDITCMPYDKSASCHGIIWKSQTTTPKCKDFEFQKIS